MIIPVVVVVVIVALGDSSSSSSISSPSLETSKGRTICRWSLDNMYLVIVPDRDMEFDNMYYQWTCGIIDYPVVVVVFYSSSLDQQ